MLRPPKLLLTGLILLVLGFAAGVVQLFKLRYERGDVYPPYSSLRADPLGAKAFYDSLVRLPGLTVSRFYQQSHKLPPGTGHTLLVLGTSPGALSSVPETEAKDLERFMSKGGRMVVTFQPVNSKTWSEQRREKREAKKKEKEKAGKPGKQERDETPDGKLPPKRKTSDDERPFKIVSLAERWGVKFDYVPLPQGEQGAYQPVMVDRQDGRELPPLLVWHTALRFDQLGSEWRVIYAREESPVLIERSFGKGSLVLSADSYLMSNEAMRQERQPQLLVWLVGGSRAVIFDETHLGVGENPGIATLIRKYRLHGVVAALVLLAGLFVWKNSVSFVPPHEDAGTEGGDVVEGKDSAAGFVNLVRRSIPARDLLKVCFEEWKKSCARGRSGLTGKLARLDGIVKEECARPAKERNPVAAYQRISHVLKERSEFRVSGSEFKVPSSEFVEASGRPGSTINKAEKL